MDKKICVRLLGGLGNQMFQYAFARYLSLKNNAELKLDVISGFKEDIHQRKYSLSIFNIIENFATKDDLPRFKLPHTEHIGIKGKLVRFINNKLPDFNNYVIKENSLTFDPSYIQINQSCYLIGYWQSELYFKPISNIIKDEFTAKCKISEESSYYLTKIANSNSVGIHIRKYSAPIKKITDKEKVFHGILTNDYYQKALGYISHRYKNLELYVFSDDINFAKEILKSSLPVKFISSGKDYEDFLLLSGCKHQIIANSSFSWWAAWLNRNDDKIVIAPKNWFAKKDINTDFIIPQDWIKI